MIFGSGVTITAAQITGVVDHEREAESGISRSAHRCPHSIRQDARGHDFLARDLFFITFVARLLRPPPCASPNCQKQPQILASADPATLVRLLAGDPTSASRVPQALRDATYKSLATKGKSGKTFAIMNSEQAHPRRCGIKQVGDTFTSLSVMNRRLKRLSWLKYSNTRSTPIC